MKILKSFGKALYDFRISQNISLDKISQITKIDQEHFEQFEKGNFSTENEVYVRLFLIEYIKCIDSSKIDDIMNNFSRLYHGKTKKELIFSPDIDKELSSSDDDDVFSVQNYTPKNIAIIIATFLIIIFIFRLVIYFTSTN